MLFFLFPTASFGGQHESSSVETGSFSSTEVISCNKIQRCIDSIEQSFISPPCCIIYCCSIGKNNEMIQIINIENKESLFQDHIFFMFYSAMKHSIKMVVKCAMRLFVYWQVARVKVDLKCHSRITSDMKSDSVELYALVSCCPRCSAFALRY